MPSSTLKYVSAVAVFVLIASILGCEEKPNQVTEATSASIEIPQSQIEAATNNLHVNGKDALRDFNIEVANLEQAVQQLLREPSIESLTAAQSSWQVTLLSLCKFKYPAQLSLAAPKEFELTSKLFYQIAAYPILPGFIDSVGEYQFSGLVNDISLPINRESIIEQHGVTDSQEVILGLYAMEYLLFGELLERGVEDFESFTQISASQTQLGLTSISEIPNNRRRKLLQLQMELLKKDAEQLSVFWSNKEILLRDWKQLESTEQVRVAKQALRTTITQLLIEIVELNKLNKIDYEGRISPATNHASMEQKASWIRDSVGSLQIGFQYLPKETVQESNKLINSIMDTTSSLTTSSDDSHKAVWESLHSAIKHLIEII